VAAEAVEQCRTVHRPGHHCARRSVQAEQGEGIAGLRDAVPEAMVEGDPLRTELLAKMNGGVHVAEVVSELHVVGSGKHEM